MRGFGTTEMTPPSSLRCPVLVPPISFRFVPRRDIYGTGPGSIGILAARRRVGQPGERVLVEFDPHWHWTSPLLCSCQQSKGGFSFPSFFHGTTEWTLTLELGFPASPV